MKSTDYTLDNKKVILSQVQKNECIMDFYEDDFCWMSINIFEDSFQLSEKVFNNRKYSLLAEKYLLEGIETFTFGDIHKFLNSSINGNRHYTKVTTTVKYTFKNELEYTTNCRYSYGSPKCVFYHGNFIMVLKNTDEVTYKDICSLSHNELMARTDTWYIDCESSYVDRTGLIKIIDYDTEFFMYPDVLKRAIENVYDNPDKFIKTAHIFNFTEDDKRHILKGKLTETTPIVVHVRENGVLMWDYSSKKK